MSRVIVGISTDTSPGVSLMTGLEVTGGFDSRLIAGTISKEGVT